MATGYLYSFLSVIVISLVSLVGVFTLSLQEERLKKYLFVLVSLALGALLGDAFIHLIPEALEEIGNATLVSITVIAGIFLFFGLENTLHWHHYHKPEEARAAEHHPVGRMILISDGLHNFIDGLIIGASYLVSIEVGIATTIAVVLHEIPQEIGDFGVLLYSGYSATQALWFNFLSALTAVLGVILALFLSQTSESLIFWIIPFAAGGFIYIALADLIPELQKTGSLTRSFIHLFVACLGVLSMVALVLLE